MMRIDPLDLADIRFLLRQEPLESRLLENAFVTACIPEIPEIQEAFSHNQKAVLAMV